MGSIPHDGKNLLRTAVSQKSLLKVFCYNKKVTRNVIDFKKVSNKESSPFNLKVLNTINISNSFHGQTFLRSTIFSVLIFGVKRLV